jgi:phage terminase large subunit-like protein
VRSKNSRRDDSERSNHRVDVYAASVVSGETIAGPLVRLACERHRRDRLRKGWTWRFDAERANQAIEFFETILKLPDLLGEDGEPAPFLLQPWQAFIVGSLFGWVDADGIRRFREAYVEIGKGNGKTPMCAGIGLYGLVMDGERAAEVYAAAADQDQAQILFRDAVRISEASPELREALTFSGGEHIWKIDHKPSLSFFKTFSRESGAKSGTRPHMGLLDELHEHGSPQISIKVRAGAKGRKNAMFVEITNSGFDRTTICWQHHEQSRKVVEQSTTDDRWFAFVCGVDAEDDPLADEGCWPKANPNLGVSITHDYLRRQVSNAKNISLETDDVLRLNFCVWTNQHTRAIDMGLWQKCRPFPTASDLLGSVCFGGLDLGLSDDFTAWVRIWVLRDGRVAVNPRFFLPRPALERYPNRPYAAWQRAGILEITEGPTTDFDLVERAVLDDCLRDGPREVAFDKRFAAQMAQHLAGAGVEMVDQPQGEWLHEAITRKLELIANGLLCHGNHEILTWMAGNYVVRRSQTTQRVRPDKEKAGDKIDGQVALDMAVARWVAMPVEGDSVYESRGALIL